MSLNQHPIRRLFFAILVVAALSLTAFAQAGPTGSCGVPRPHGAALPPASTSP